MKIMIKLFLSVTLLLSTAQSCALAMGAIHAQHLREAAAEHDQQAAYPCASVNTCEDATGYGLPINAAPIHCAVTDVVAGSIVVQENFAPRAEQAAKEQADTAQQPDRVEVIAKRLYEFGQQLASNRVCTEKQAIADMFAQITFVKLYEEDHGKITNDAVYEGTVSEAKKLARKIINRWTRPCETMVKIGCEVVLLLCANGSYDWKPKSQDITIFDGTESTLVITTLIKHKRELMDELVCLAGHSTMIAILNDFDKLLNDTANDVEVRGSE